MRGDVSLGMRFMHRIRGRDLEIFRAKCRIEVKSGGCYIECSHLFECSPLSESVNQKLS